MRNVFARWSVHTLVTLHLYKYVVGVTDGTGSLGYPFPVFDVVREMLNRRLTRVVRRIVAELHSVVGLPPAPFARSLADPPVCLSKGPALACATVRTSVSRSVPRRYPNEGLV